MRRIAVLLLLSSLAGCVTEVGGLIAAPWDLIPRPAELDFGTLAVGSESTAVVTLVNEGPGGASVGQILVAAQAGAAFSLPENWSGDIGPLSDHDVSVTFHPDEEGTYEDHLIVTVLGTGDVSTVEIPILGQAVNSAIRAWPAVLDFGPVEVGDTVARSLTLQNMTDAEIEISSWLVDGESGFSVQAPLECTTFPCPIPGDGTIALSVRYEASSTDIAEGTLHLFGPDAVDYGVSIELRANDCEGSADPGWDGDEDGVTVCGGDCDDTEDNARPGLIETPDLMDNDCDGLVDEGTELGDDDGDGFSEAEGDCNDTSADTYIGATEIANGFDDDCDGDVDEGTSADDGDNDGYTPPAGDCVDTDASIYPGAPETVDGWDDDCDGLIDETTPAYDDDGDGYCDDPTTCITPWIPGDCNDGDPGANPGQTEVVNGVDDDCDGTVDNGTPVSDNDGDGYAGIGGDCDDANPNTYPGAPEIADAADNDCDSAVDEGTIYSDDDSDGFTEFAGDCNDNDFFVFPSALEDLQAVTPGEGDGIDNNCNGVVDEGTTTFDDDGDGVTEQGGDCDDTSTAISPALWDYPGDGVDADCNGTD